MSARKTLVFAMKILSSRIKEPKLPWRINLAITYSCNARCLMCNVWRKYAENPVLIHEEMGLEHFDKLFSELSSHLLWLHITGGEPFLRSDLVEIVKSAVNRCKNLYAIEIPTNGLVPTFIETRVRQLLEVLQEHRVALGIGVSVDGPPEIHDYVRGVKGAWEKAVESLKRLKELERSYNNLNVAVAYTITKHTAGCLPELYDRLQEMVDLSPSDILVNVEHVGALYHTSGRADYREVREKIAKDVSWLLNHYRREHPRSFGMWVWSKFRYAFTQLIMRYVDEPAKMLIPCEALRSVVFIDPYGDVYPCITWGVKLGNVTTSSLRDILCSETSASARGCIQRGECPNCWTGCEAMPTLLIRYWKAILKTKTKQGLAWPSLEVFKNF
jgi:MoaA/NifB/PqqE/SkfB family radical SAM enzyme